MINPRSLVTVCLLLCFCMLHTQASTDSGFSLAGAPVSVTLPHGRELGDAELLTVEGEIAFLLALIFATTAGAATGAGVAAIHENWFDEDYGIDGDDWRQIGFGAIGGAMLTASAGLIGHYVGPM